MFLSVYLPNGIGIALMIMLLITNRNHFLRDRRLRNLCNMMCITIISSVCEMLAFAFDGKPGVGVTVLLYVTNSWVFLADILIAYCWLNLECDCMGVKSFKIGNRVMTIIDGIGLLVLIINLFYPIVFSIDNNVYSRCGLFWLYIVIAGINIVYGIALYLISKKKGRILTPFSVEFFVIPLVIGMTIQAVFFGVSVIWVSIAVAITGMASVLKDSLLEIDAMTRVYNRYFLERLTDKNRNSTDYTFFGIMADINNFKAINDTYGHDVGDEVIIAATEIFIDAVKNRGMVIRNGGDEFVILIDSRDSGVADEITKDIEQGCRDYSENNKHGLELSVSMGAARYSGEERFDDFLSTLDKLMYEKKQEYHRLHDHTEAINVKLGAIQLSSDILKKSNIGLWAIELDEGKAPRMYADDVMLSLLELPQHISPEETFHTWFDNIDESSRGLLKKAVDRMVAGEHAEVQAPWRGPSGKQRIVRGEGMRNYDYQKGIRIEGTHQDVTRTIHFDKEAHDANQAEKP